MGHLFGREPEGISEDFNQRGKKPIELLWWWWLLGQLNSRHSQLLHQWVITCFSEALNWMRFVFLCSLDCQGWKRPQRSSSSIPQQSLSPGYSIFISRSSHLSSLTWTDRAGNSLPLKTSLSMIEQLSESSPFYGSELCLWVLVMHLSWSCFWDYVGLICLLCLLRAMERSLGSCHVPLSLFSCNCLLKCVPLCV